jgi:hypothetical protein
MKALSIKQPYATSILRGTKTIELRSWQTAYRGDLLICTSLTPAYFLRKTPILDKEGRHKVVDEITEREDYMYFGKALCVVELYDIQQMKEVDEKASESEFYDDLFSWCLRNVRPIKPFDVVGRLNLYEVNEPIVFLKGVAH